VLVEEFTDSHDDVVLAMGCSDWTAARLLSRQQSRCYSYLHSQATTVCSVLLLASLPIAKALIFCMIYLFLLFYFSLLELYAFTLLFD